MTPQQKKATAVALATALAVPAEGLRQVAYYDPPGILTVCEGHTGKDIIKGKVYSLAECKAFLSADMQKAVDEVDRCAPDLPDNVLAAFGDAAYNLGPKIACDPAHSTAARLLKAHNITGACNELTKWDKASVAGQMISLPGLTKRRQAEKALCLGEIQ
ncbi:lysozyme [Polynucleobacter sp. UK-Kesae-W10]|uniref:lysozyme n=1 Tax=Polynucleobacter sp. UK-Kesae-W10 TaxID=1819738 RepID=UPI001C0BCE36|nr:lysozyme [Polynucleobacter sp. UK-Kesae-W10]MBU3577563.1 lysozyme [Polynucleobacter sp. UK-Kesae-W10]